MKKKYLIIYLLLFLLIPFKAFALDIFTFSVKDTNINFQTNDLIFSNIKLVDNSRNSSMSFGITGKVLNNSDTKKEYNTKVLFYDKNNNLLAKSSVNQVAKAGQGLFNHLLNTSELNGKKINEIDYFNIEVSDETTNDITDITPSNIDDYRGRDYVIDKYDVDIIVNEDNTFDITENITAHYNVQKHGIIRNIPLKNNIKRLDGTTSSNKVKISDVSVDANYKTSKTFDQYSIKIGDANVYLKGENHYTIKYKYDIGKDPSKEYDELYFNIIGTEWDTVIGNVSFTITMPKEFDATKLGFSKGTSGSTNNDGIKYSIDENVITGNYNGVLGVGEGLTVRLELPEGYFIRTQSIFEYLKLEILIPIIALIISFMIWFLRCRNSLIIAPVEFYPPDDYNSLEIAFMYNGEANDKNVVSLLIYLANKGYLKIEESKKDGIFNYFTDYKIIKIKDYDGDNDLERKFMEGLFRRKKYEKNENGEFEYTTLNSLRYSFYRTIESILKTINHKDNIQKILEKRKLEKVMIAILIIIAFFAMILVPIYNIEGIEGVMSMSILVVYIPFFAVGVFAKMPLPLRLFWLGFTIFHCSMFLSVTPFYSTLFNSKESILLFIIGIICLVIMVIIYNNIKKRTEFGAKMYGRIKGFREFLITAEKEKLEEMVEKNPSYFYDILPYTYVLNISKKWIKKFETITIREPSWYNSQTAFNYIEFSHFINSTMSSATRSMTVSPSSSGGGSSGGFSGGSSSGSSGGGSSGGGSGGGGGSSW